MRAHVQYDSRLELARLLLADFDPSVKVIVAQPFQLRECKDSSVLRRHIPDFLLVHADRTVTIVNVKTPAALADHKVRSVFGWVTGSVSAHGWRHEIWSGGDPNLLANVRFLAGYRRAHYQTDLLREVARVAPGRTIGDISGLIGDRSYNPEVRSAVFHLLWWHILRTALDDPLSANTVIAKVSCP